MYSKKTRPPFRRSAQEKDTSWQPVSDWYKSSVGDQGHYYHQHVVLPETLRLLNLQADSSLLDLGCGQGVLARSIPETVYYQGLDAAKSLITYAKERAKNELHHFTVADVTRVTIPIQKKDFTHATIILALQNMNNDLGALKNAAAHLQVGGKLAIVLNHPCFRIPRQSSWGVDEAKKTQYRRVDRYFSPLEIPIAAHPGQPNSATTLSFHRPLQHYFQILNTSGFAVTNLEEWTSDKQSIGKAAKMENRGRREFPLFLTLVAIKQ